MLTARALFALLMMRSVCHAPSQVLTDAEVNNVQSCENIRRALEACNAPGDLKQFVQERGTGAKIYGKLYPTPDPQDADELHRCPSLRRL